MSDAPPAALAFLLGRRPDPSMDKGGDDQRDTPRSANQAEGSSDENEKPDRDLIDEYYRLSKNKRYAFEELVTLAALEEGREGEIVLAVGGHRLIMRLCDLGLTPGTKFRVLKKGLMGGPIILEVRSCEIAIGRGIASKILVKQL